MINIDELKPIIEPLLTDENSAEVIEAIQAIDREVEVDQKAIDDLNASWNERFKKAFFGDGSAEGQAEAQADETEDAGVQAEEEDAPTKYEDLFSDEEVKED